MSKTEPETTGSRHYNCPMTQVTPSKSTPSWSLSGFNLADQHQPTLIPQLRSGYCHTSVPATLLAAATSGSSGRGRQRFGGKSPSYLGRGFKLPNDWFVYYSSSIISIISMLGIIIMSQNQATPLSCWFQHRTKTSSQMMEPTCQIDAEDKHGSTMY